MGNVWLFLSLNCCYSELCYSFIVENFINRFQVSMGTIPLDHEFTFLIQSRLELEFLTLCILCGLGLQLADVFLIESLRHSCRGENPATVSTSMH